MGSNDSRSNSRPLTAAERLETYNAGVKAMNPEYGEYQAPQTERLGEGDYAKVQEGLYAPIDRAKSQDLKRNDQAMSDRGIYTSMNAIRSNNDVSERYAPQYAATGVSLANLKAQDIAGANANKLTVADKEYDSKWRPEDYKAGVWNGTGGVISSTKTDGWSI